jgi:glycosyltransferase involved in cell wall biosynthesis
MRISLTFVLGAPLPKVAWQVVEKNILSSSSNRNEHFLQLRILHILTTPRAEGTPRLVLDWLTAGSEHWQAVMTLKSTPADLTSQFELKADQYVGVDVLDRRRMKYFDMFRAVRRTVQSVKPDLVISWSTGFSNWISVAARLGGCKGLIVHAGNPTSPPSFRSNLITYYVLLPLLAVRAHVICCSDYVRDSYRRLPMIPKDLLNTVYNCTTVDKFEKAWQDIRVKQLPTNNGLNARKTMNSIMVATLESHKDHRTLLQACALIRKQSPSFRLRLVGDGRLRSELEQLSQELDLVSSVEFLGTRDDVPTLLANSDLFIFSTTPQEGLGSVLLEAMAARLPIVASDVPACRELLEGGKWGTLVPPANAVELSQAVVRQLSIPIDDQARENAAEYASSFTPQRMMHQYLAKVGLA